MLIALRAEFYSAFRRPVIRQRRHIFSPFLHLG
jgi:hypothetical protein